jgi:hypothetical protein
MIHLLPGAGYKDRARDFKPSTPRNRPDFLTIAAILNEPRRPIEQLTRRLPHFRAAFVLGPAAAVRILLAPLSV